MFLSIIKTAGSAVVSILMKGASEEFFKKLILMLVKMAVESSKTKYDDKILKLFEENL